MSFTLVFPSNAQPNRYNNTAASFQTDLEEAIPLEGNWEVALQEMSYVNSMKTLMNESLMLGHSKEDVSISSLEHQDKVITYDFYDDIEEWSDQIVTMRRRRRRNDALVP